MRSASSSGPGCCRRAERGWGALRFAARRPNAKFETRNRHVGKQKPDPLQNLPIERAQLALPDYVLDIDDQGRADQPQPAHVTCNRAANGSRPHGFDGRGCRQELSAIAGFFAGLGQHVPYGRASSGEEFEFTTHDAMYSVRAGSFARSESSSGKMTISKIIC